MSLTSAGTDRRGLTHEQKVVSATLAASSKAAGFGPQTPKPERDAEIRRLAAAGCTNADLARLFCLSENGARVIREDLHARQLTQEEWELVKLHRRIGQVAVHSADECCCKHCPWDGNHGS